jgi:hypothetical protein
MAKKITLKPGDTISGLFDKMKKGESIRLSRYDVKESSIRQEAVRRNRDARVFKEVAPYQKKFSVSNQEKEGFLTVTYNEN